MWTKIRLKNFRLYKDTKDITLAPLTFFIGPNSSGKSTMLKAFLLLRQSIESRDLRIPIVPDGNYCELGVYHDYIFRGDAKQKLEFHLEWTARKDADGKNDNIGFNVIWSYDNNRSEVFVKELEYKLNGKRSIKATKNNHGSYGLESGHHSAKGFGFDSIKRLIRFYGTALEIRDQEKTTKDFFNHLSWLEKELEHQISSVYYLSPLRLQPKQAYPVPQDRPSDAGLMGERAGDIMFKFNNEDLMEKIAYWAKKTGIAQSISVYPIENNLYTIEIASVVNMAWQSNISHVGFGVPQSLPILVQGLYQEPDTTLLLEQPEIHLNPKIQAEMADFFIHLATDNKHRKQLIIETHSEHILNRVRTWIAQGKMKPDMVAVYYCNAKKAGGTIKKLEITELGQFINWPKGFFLEEIDEAMKQTKAVIKRNSKKEKVEG